MYSSIFYIFLWSLRDCKVQYWLRGPRHAHTNGVFCGEWLWSLCITLRCHYVVSLFVCHGASQLHMALPVLPPTPCLSLWVPLAQRFCSWALCPCLWHENKSSMVFNAVKCARENATGIHCVCWKCQKMDRGHLGFVLCWQRLFQLLNVFMMILLLKTVKFVSVKIMVRNISRELLHYFNPSPPQKDSAY